MTSHSPPGRRNAGDESTTQQDSDARAAGAAMPASDRAIGAALRHAAARGELSLVYQPQVAIDTGAIVGVEALLRWQHPTLGAMSPERFIPLAETLGLIGEIGEWVLRRACLVARKWQRRGLPPIRMMVNVSGHQLQSGGLAARVEGLLQETGLEPRRFGIEVTETVLMRNMALAALELERLRRMGVEIALDDFGTGYSSLSHLCRLPVDVVKIDKSLMPKSGDGGDTLPIVRAVIAMTHCLGMRVLAEGVANESQLELMAANGCDRFQGYHFSPPAPAEQIEAMLVGGRKLPVLERRRSVRTRNVLLVDDDPRVLARLRQGLSWHFGDTVTLTTCADPREAARHLHETRFDVLVSDLRMPEMDGMSLMNLARQLHPYTVRMMLLGPTDLARVLDDRAQVDVFRYLSKPWTLEQFRAHFQAALDEVDRIRAEGRLVSDIRAPLASFGTPALEMMRLEQAEPGITAVDRGPMDEVLLPSQLLTMPGDLWTSSAQAAA